MRKKKDKRFPFAFWIPIIVSIVAVIFTGLQWYEAHQQKRLLIKPLVSFYIEDDVKESQKGLAIENHGTGPAVIKSIRYFVDHQPVDDYEVMWQYGNLDSSLDQGIELDDGDALGAGQRVWLIDYRTKNDKEMRRLMEYLGNRLAVEVHYCSIDDECGRKCSTKGGCSK